MVALEEEPHLFYPSDRADSVAGIGNPLPYPEPQETWNLERVFFQAHSNSQKRSITYPVAIPESPLSLCKTWFCADGSSSRCLACTPFVTMSVPFLFYFTQRGWHSTHPTTPILSLITVTGNFRPEPWAEKFPRDQAGFWGGVRSKPVKVGRQVSKASLEAIPPSFTTYFPCDPGSDEPEMWGAYPSGVLGYLWSL